MLDPNPNLTVLWVRSVWFQGLHKLDWRLSPAETDPLLLSMSPLISPARKSPDRNAECRRAEGRSPPPIYWSRAARAKLNFDASPSGSMSHEGEKWHFSKQQTYGLLTSLRTKNLKWKTTLKTWQKVEPLYKLLRKTVRKKRAVRLARKGLRWNKCILFIYLFYLNVFKFLISIFVG